MTILRLAANGYSNKEIAEVVHLREQTIKNQWRKILDKLDARNKAHAVAIALRDGLIR